MTDQIETDAPPVTELSKSQRRVLGVLVEKAFTTPEYYPLTLKAVTTGCNQKSNRSPPLQFDEDTVETVLEELYQLGLAAEVHTDGGRAMRYRHYMRKRFTFSEPQLAIMIELLLRGRQQLGELRSRANRMVAIDSLDQLRDELRGLQSMNMIQSSGSLERRGIEVDHCLYTAREQQKLGLERNAQPAAATPAPSAEGTGGLTPTARLDETTAVAAGTSEIDERFSRLEAENEQTRIENQTLHGEIDDLKESIRGLEDKIEQLRQDLGG